MFTVSAPILGGWGGERLVDDLANSNTTSATSAVFSGEQHASNFEQITSQAVALGHNAVRGSFAPSCSISHGYGGGTQPANFEGDYSSTSLQRAISIAQHFGLYLIVDDHGYSETADASTSRATNGPVTNCWLDFWSPIITLGNTAPYNYANIIWEPENEPTNLTSTGDFAQTQQLAGAYQQWVNQARSLGDTHWVVLQNLCSYSCSNVGSSSHTAYLDAPVVNDTQNRIFQSIHTYMDYGTFQGSSWTNSTAKTLAGWYLKDMSHTVFPTFSTEGGADPLCNCMTGNGDTTYSVGSDGFTKVTFNFTQTMVDYEDLNHFSRLLWVMANWTSSTGYNGVASCNGCLYGSMETGQWGSKISDFSISVSPSSGSTGQGTEFRVTISMSSIRQVYGNVNLTLTCSVCGNTVDPNKIWFSWGIGNGYSLLVKPGGSNSTLLGIEVGSNVTAAPNTGTTYTITISGQSVLIHPTTLTLTVTVVQGGGGCKPQKPPSGAPVKDPLKNC